MALAHKRSMPACNYCHRTSSFSTASELFLTSRVPQAFGRSTFRFFTIPKLARTSALHMKRSKPFWRNSGMPVPICWTRQQS